MEKTDKKQKPLLARNIVARRKKLGWKNAHILAEKARIPYGTLRDIEAGYSEGRIENREAIADALGCSVEDLYLPEQTELSPSEIGKSLADLKQEIRGLKRQAESGIPADIIEMINSIPEEKLDLLRSLLSSAVQKWGIPKKHSVHKFKKA